MFLKVRSVVILKDISGDGIWTRYKLNDCKIQANEAIMLSESSVQMGEDGGIIDTAESQVSVFILSFK